MWQEYFNVTTLQEAQQILAERAGQARIIAGGTDLILEMERGIRRGIHTLIDISRIPGLDQIVLDEDGYIHLGPLVTHNHCVESRLIVDYAFPLAQAAWQVGAPQIRNRGTVAGNLITASPANDTITPLMALGARVLLASVNGSHWVPLDRFYSGVRRIVMQPDEMLVDIAFPAMKPYQHGTFIKLGLRRAQAISLVNVCVLVTFDNPLPGSEKPPHIENATITLGAVAPVIIHAEAAEAFLHDRTLDKATIEQAASLVMQASRPIDDIRGSAEYRREMTRVCAARALRRLAIGDERNDFPANPVLLGGQAGSFASNDVSTSDHNQGASPIITSINGRQFIFTSGHDKTLLRLLREDAGLTGTKEGCAEGECGACTVFLDGMAVMSCLVPAPRAHGAEIVTIEGVASEGVLHPVQQAFVQAGAVQCGYCTPGFVMSAVKLLQEHPHPDRNEIQQAITGNLCRCTGYYKIVEAIEQAAEMV